MRSLKKLLIGGGVAAALVFGASAMAKTAAQLHEMEVALPDGAIAYIHYSGDKPTVTLGQSRTAAPWLSAWADPLWPASDASLFAVPDMREMNARMDRQLAVMRAEIERIDQLASNPAFTQTSSGSSSVGSFCARSVEITQGGANAPRVEERSYGNCGQRNGAGAAAPRAATRA